MKQIKIETITPVHIGSGRELSANTEYLVFNEIIDNEQQTVLSVIDEEKILEIIGSENIDKWVNIINSNESLLSYLRQRRANISSKDVKKRNAIFYGSNASHNKTLKEQLHDGRQISYIPGSSIKGAMRTAIVTHFANKNKELAKRNLKDKKKHKFSGQEFEKRLFGSNPNEDVFRFLQIRDAFFEYPTIALKAEIFNMFRNNWDFKRGGSHLVEAIPDGAITRFGLKINKELLKLNKSQKETSFLNETKLFEIINSHTQNLLKREIDFLSEINTRAESFADYLDWLNDIYGMTNECIEKEAILRIGFGSGWRFITGSWATDEAIMNDYDYEKFLNTVRKQNKYDDSVPFPKSRKIGDEGDMFGFVKLKIED